MNSVSINQFLNLMENFPCFDVRTPSEYSAGHIPGAVNLPLFTDHERAVVGTLYKRSGRDRAVLTGLEIVGPKMKYIVETIKKRSRGKKALIHCWRGGMRSNSVAYISDLAGIETFVLEKGYKAYRTWCINQFGKDRTLLILSGKTGSGKTEILHHLRSAGEQVIDLEGIAHHKGSAFGALGETKQPTQEQFENNLGMLLSKFDSAKRIWIEDESLQIGRCVVPENFWPKMRTAPVMLINSPFERRADYLFKTYGSFTPFQLCRSINRIEKKLGSENTNKCIRSIERGDIHFAINLVLGYYDKSYAHGLSKRETGSLSTINVEPEDSFETIARKCIEKADNEKR